MEASIHGSLAYAECGMNTAMMKRLTMAVFLMLALLSVSSGTPRPRCSMMPEVAASSCGCCATMKSCVVTQQEDPVQSAASAYGTQQLAAMIAPVLQELLAAPIAPSPRSDEVSPVQPPVRSTARLALLCTFLI